MNQKTENIAKVIASKGFQALLKRRNSLRFILTVLTLLVHAFFVGGIAFYNDFFATPLYEGSSIPLGVFFYVLVIVLFLLLELFYSMVSHRQFDSMQNQVREEIKQHV